MIKYILWDIDGTLLNFDLAETRAIRKCFKDYGLGELSDEKLIDYKNINKYLWKKLEKDEITRIQVLEGRFKILFDKYGYKVDDIPAYNIDYQKALGQTYVLNENARKAIEKLGNKYAQYGVTNGSIIAQEGKLRGAKLDKYLRDVFISERIGYEKPAKEFFDYVFDQVGSSDPYDYIIVGDSLSSDIRGGNVAGIKTIWYNPASLINDLGVKVDYEVRDLIEIVDILEENNE
ncbi:MAG: YjjG family noncanonical pyrimidine nucleotidase [Anaerococcus sp.]|nr:YjjG family noncanonical pyrimidine nucleotidase [Anaerococcus sp.]